MASSRTPPSESSTGSHGRRSKRSSAATSDTAIAKYLLRSRYLLDNRTASKSETVKAAKTVSNLRKSMKIMSKFWEEVDTLDEETIGSGLSLLKTVLSLTKNTVKDLERTTSFPDSSRIYDAPELKPLADTITSLTKGGSRSSESRRPTSSGDMSGSSGKGRESSRVRNFDEPASPSPRRHRGKDSSGSPSSLVRESRAKTVKPADEEE